MVETLDVDFPSGLDRRGIFRFWDRHDANDDRARRNVEDLDITMDGEPVQVDRSSRQRGRYTVARIGSPDVLVTPGVHTYRIAYTIEGVIIAGRGDRPSTFFWNLIPAGWGQWIDRAELRVHLPAPAEAVRCGVGLGDEPPPCDLTGDGTDELVITTGLLAPNTPVTLRTGLAIPTPPAGNTLPWPTRFDPVLGSHPILLGVVAVLTAVTVGLGLTAARRSIETEPPFPLQYAPPEGIGPAQASYILNETNRDDAYVATLMHAAQHGAIDLQRNDDGWTITERDDPEAWASVDPVTRGIFHLLGDRGASFTAAKEDEISGEQLKAEIDRFEGDTANWALSSGTMTSVGLGDFGPVLVIVAFVVTVVIGFWNPLSMSSIGLVPGGFVAGGVSLLLPGASTKRTAIGRDLWSRVGGFQRVLSTPSSRDRFDFAGRQDLYTAYLPWAVAFGCADAWADKYRTEVGTEPPIPLYFGPMYAGTSPSRFVDSMVQDFRSTLDSAISSYEATQSSSSGGGFSGGGGGGGGGGGSW